MTALRRLIIASREARFGVLVVLVIAAIVSFAPPPGASHLSGELHNFGHVVVFAVIGYVVARLLVRATLLRVGGLAAVVITLLLGGALGYLTELAQSLMGGYLSRGDIARDLLGTLVGLIVAISQWPPFVRFRPWLLLAATVGFAVGAQSLVSTLLDYRARAAQMPVLFDPAAVRTARFVEHKGAYAMRTVPLPAPWARQAGEVAIEVSLDRGPWPGLTLAEPTPDWRAWRTLLVDVTNPGEQPLELILRVDDARHNGDFTDRYNGPLLVPARTRTTFRVALADIANTPRGRRLEMQRIEKLMVFHGGAIPGARVLISRIELAR